MLVVTTGAFDRFNYGDLLFPIVLEHAFDGKANILHLATIASSSDISGAKPTIGIREMRKFQQAPDAYILGGGELLGANWYQASLALSSKPGEFLHRASHRIVPVALLDGLAKRRFGGTWSTPYVPDADTLGKSLLVANAIGASSISSLSPKVDEQITNSLRRAQYLSVRDRAGMQLLRSRDLSAVLAPDSAACMARLPALKSLAVEKGASKLVFQCSRHWANSYARFLPDLIRTLSREFDAIEFLPIGLARGHSDLDALSRLHSAMIQSGVNNVSIVPVSKIGDCISSISSASAFVGTSLHGHITAMAFGVPAVGLNGISKLNHYVETWGQGITPFDIHPSGVPAAIRQSLLESTSRLVDRAEYLAGQSLADQQRVVDASLS